MKTQSNKSLDVRAKQRLSIALSFYPDVARGGFVPRQLNRWARLGEIKQDFSVKCAKINLPLEVESQKYEQQIKNHQRIES